jgi:hypothetical protein
MRNFDILLVHSLVIALACFRFAAAYAVVPDKQNSVELIRVDPTTPAELPSSLGLDGCEPEARAFIGHRQDKLPVPKSDPQCRSSNDF